MLLLFCLLPILIVINYLFVVFKRETITIKGVEIHAPYWYLEALEPKTKVVASRAGKTVAAFLNYAQKLDLYGCVGYQLRLFRSNAESVTTMMIRATLPIEEFRKSYNENRVRPIKISTRHDHLADDPLVYGELITKSSKRKLEQPGDLTQATILTNAMDPMLSEIIDKSLNHISPDTSDDELTVPDIQTDPMTRSLHHKDE